MDRISKLVSSIAFAFCGHVYAGYAQLAPPTGWAPTSVGGSAGTFNYGKAANGASLVGNTVRTTASLNVGGRIISVPASMRFASNAPKVLAGRVGASLAVGGGAILTGGMSVAAALLLPIAVEWWQQTEFEWDGNKWLKKKKVLDGYWTDVYGYGQYPTPDAACNARLSNVWAVMVPGNPSRADCHAGPTAIAGSVIRIGNETIETTVVPYEPKVREALENTPLPEKLPGIIPLDYPVDLPVINPSPAMQPQPLFVPTGNPVPNPNYDPQATPGPENMPYLQPGIRVVPAPVPGAPWQVDVQPVNRPVLEPTPKPDPVTDGSGNPNDKETDKEPGLCDMYPDILACQKLDDPTSNDLQSLEKPISITPDAGWGSEDAACPAPRILNVQGQQIAIPFDLFCTYMQGMRPIIIAMAWLSAAFILIGARESS